MKVLQLTVHLFPNVGGVETHLKDLINSLVRRNYRTFVLAYQPLSTKIDWRIFEKNKNLTILRIPWIRGFFEKLVPYPFLEFIYLVPGLFIVTPLILLLFRPNVIHAHGLSAAVSAVVWGKIFGMRVVISLHSFYKFPKKGLYHKFIQFLLDHSDFVLSLSKKSNEEVISLGLDRKMCGVFTYWIDLNKFKLKSEKLKVKKLLEWDRKFIVLFVGRLVEGKGIDQLIQSAKTWDKGIHLILVGSGPLENKIHQNVKRVKNIHFLGKIEQDNLPMYYSGTDCVIVPSTSEEGFGRVIIESLACGTPVFASKRGAIPEAMDETVGKFIEVTPESIRQVVEYFYQNPKKLKELSENTRKYAERRYSERNVETIIKAYME